MFCQSIKIEGENMHLTDEEQNKLIWFLQPNQALMYLKTPALKLIASDYSPVPFRARNNSWGRANFAWQKLIDKIKIENEKRRGKILLKSRKMVCKSPYLK